VIGRGKEIEAGDLDEPDALVQLRVGRARDDVDGMAEIP
jgi:hypothetical protein